MQAKTTRSDFSPIKPVRMTNHAGVAVRKHVPLKKIKLLLFELPTGLFSCKPYLIQRVFQIEPVGPRPGG